LTNALIIEFDTYDNDGGTGDDLSCDHIAVEIDGDLPDDPANSPANQAPYAGPVCAISGGGDIEDAVTHTVDITWDAGTQALSVSFDGAQRLTTTGDFVNTVFGGQNILYWGATAATGGLNNQQYFCPSTVIVVLPVSLISFNSTCNGDEEIIEWTTATEHNVDYFQLEYTYNGLVFHPIETYDAVGNSTEEITYRAVVDNKDDNQRYYRLKMVDNNGNHDYTDIISSKHCGNSSVVVQSLEDLGSSFKAKLTLDGSYSIINNLGQQIAFGRSENQLIHVNKMQYSMGMYYLNIVLSDGRSETKKLYIQH
ncbi:MAG: hypothetical protein JKY09_07095, partial [Crocinitomicaceae bacterium]|nr:hypothetical protein [Crocinitomicaceae bacterium]